MQNKVEKLVSGGQTGADRAALDFALEKGWAMGGFVPKGRLAEDGQIPEKYEGLKETDSSDPAVRTRMNVAHSDATLVLTHGPVFGGSKLTYESALETGKPVFRLDLLQHNKDVAAEMAGVWLNETGVRSLNIAGPRASEDERIYQDVLDLLRTLFVG